MQRTSSPAEVTLNTAWCDPSFWTYVAPDFVLTCNLSTLSFSLCPTQMSTEAGGPPLLDAPTLSDILDACMATLGAGGESRTAVEAPLLAYVACATEAEAQLAEAVEEFCTPEGAERYAAAVARGPRDHADMVVAAIEAIGTAVPGSKRQKTRSVNKADKGQHASIRYDLYRRLASAVGYSGLVPQQRVPLPIVMELLVKASFPGGGVVDFTCFVPTAAESLRVDCAERNSTNVCEQLH